MQRRSPISSAVGGPADVLSVPKPTFPTVEAMPGLVIVHGPTRTTGRIVRLVNCEVYIKTFTGREDVFTNVAGVFSVEGRRVELVAPVAHDSRVRSVETASGSLARSDEASRTARQSRLFVEGRHDAELIEKVWGDDLRYEGVVVEILGGLDNAAEALCELRPTIGRRAGILADHLVDGTKESRIAAEIAGPFVMVAGHPYVDVWQAIRPSVAGISAWPSVPMSQDWKTGICVRVGDGADPTTFWRQILVSVTSYDDLETPFVNAVERLIDFVTAP